MENIATNTAGESQIRRFAATRTLLSISEYYREGSEDGEPIPLTDQEREERVQQIAEMISRIKDKEDDPQLKLIYQSY